MKKIELIKFIVSIVLVPVFIGIVTFGMPDKFSSQAKIISNIQQENNTKYVTSFIKEDYKYSNYYNANAFYKVQQLSAYWNYEKEERNSIFFRYDKVDETSLFSIESPNGNLIETGLVVPLSKNPINCFSLTLVTGDEKHEKDKKCFDYIYVTDKLADKIIENFYFVKDNTENHYSDLLYNDKISCVLNYVTSLTSVKTTKKPTLICGIIDSTKIGFLSDFCNQCFACASWTEDLQLTINCPDLFVTYFKDHVKNQVYLRELDFLNQEGSKWHNYFSDTNGKMDVGNNDLKVKDCTTEPNTILVVLAVVILSLYVYLFVSLRSLKIGEKYMLFLSVVVLTLMFSLLAISSLFPFNNIISSVNLFSSYMILTVPLLSLIIFYKKNTSRYMELKI